ncbi:MAG: choice-of-anchor Q domain-containing protein [Rudaea sp.]|nr:choice-of-anchor Q domain-containing protein [Rudaea sp.]
MKRHPLAVALSFAIAAAASVASAATIQVTTADDPTGTVNTCTLRQAIASMNGAAIASPSNCVNNSANGFGTGDAITFAPGVTSVTLADSTNNELLITDSDLTITGSGSGGVTVSRVTGATHSFRIFHDTGSTGAAFQEILNLSGLTITNGATIAANASGGAILMEPSAYTTARLAMTNCVVSGSSTSGASAEGGAIAGSGTAAMHSGTAVTLMGSTVSGNSTDNSNAGGGAIYAAAVTLKDSIVSGNTTMGATSPGGAIQAVDVNMSYSTVSHNSTVGNNSPGGGIAAQSTRYATGGFSGNYNIVSYNSTAGTQSPGGGIYAASTPTLGLSNEIISNNSTSAADSNGGGIYVSSYYGVSFESSTISGNAVTNSSSSGGGIWSRFGKGVIKHVFESTISGNSAAGQGSAISINVCSSSAARALNIYNSTMAFNTADAVGGGAVYAGNVGCPAAESTKPTSGLVTITSSILSNNSSDIAAQTGFALTVDTSFDLIQNPPSGGAITLVNAGDSPAVISVDPLLKALADNGCFKMSGAAGGAACVQTHAIGCRSVAFNSGSNPLGDSYDERGNGFPRVSDSTTDIGAYQFSYTVNGDEIFCNGFESYQ